MEKKTSKAADIASTVIAVIMGVAIIASICFALAHIVSLALGALMILSGLVQAIVMFALWRKPLERFGQRAYVKSPITLCLVLAAAVACIWFRGQAGLWIATTVVLLWIFITPTRKANGKQTA